MSGVEEDELVGDVAAQDFFELLNLPESISIGTDGALFETAATDMPHYLGPSIDAGYAC